MSKTLLSRSNASPLSVPQGLALRRSSRRLIQPGDRSNCRRGVATIELAICLPILLLVTLLFIEFTNLIFLRQTLRVASYEGIRVAVKPGAELSDVTNVCAQIFDGRDVTGYDITVEPDDFSNVQRGTLITVNIEVNHSQNQLFGLIYGGDDFIYVQGFGLKE